MRASEFTKQSVTRRRLAELLNTKPSKKTKARWEHDDETGSTLRFESSNGLTYELSIIPIWMAPDEVHPWEFADITDEQDELGKYIIFSQIEDPRDWSKDKTNITGAGSAAEVFGIVSNGILQYVKRVKPPFLMMQAIEINRRRLYSAMVSRLLPLIPGYKSIGPKQDGMYFIYDSKQISVDQIVTEGTSKLNYIGNCTDDDVIEHLFGDATGFAQAVEEYGDDFELDDLVVKYDPESDIHSFYYKQQGVAEDTVDEMALQTYKTMGDFTKPGPFTGADKKLVPHPKNIEKATRFFEQTPFDFRLFFSHLKGTGKYSEHGPMSPDQIRQVFGQDAEEIINGSEDAITVVYVGNKGDAKVMLTPWMMAHRFGHAINAGARNKNWTAWGEAENYFFQTVNNLLDEHYGKVPATKPPGRNMLFQLTPEYNALFNAMGTQRSSTSGQIRRPYEFLYELFAQYLGTGKVTLNPLPTNLGYGRRVFGNPTKYMNIKPEYRDEGERKQAADSLAYTMELLFNDVLSDSVGKIFVM